MRTLGTYQAVMAVPESQSFWRHRKQFDYWLRNGKLLRLSDGEVICTTGGRKFASRLAKRGMRVKGLE